MGYRVTKSVTQISNYENVINSDRSMSNYEYL